MTQPRVRPIQKFATAVGKCGPQAKKYGQCVIVDYNNVSKNLCQTEFVEFKNCVMENLKKKPAA